VLDLCYVYFFFTRRRRHTRSKRDWRSDVCSSDLNIEESRLTKEFGSSNCSGSDPYRARARGILPGEDSASGAQPMRSCGPRSSRSEERRVGKEGDGAG